MYHYFFNLKDLIKWLIVSHCSRDCVVLCVVWLALHYPLKLSTLSSEDLCDLCVKTPLFNCKMSSTPPHIAYLQAVLRRGSRFKSSHHYHFLFFFFRKTFTQKLWEQMIQDILRPWALSEDDQRPTICVNSSLTRGPRPRREDVKITRNQTKTKNKRSEERRLTGPLIKDPEE